jgi:hypothetical protein
VQARLLRLLILLDLLLELQLLRLIQALRLGCQVAGGGNPLEEVLEGCL